jgi:hypothetical protein
MRIPLLAILACAAAAQTFPEPPPLVRVIRTPLPDRGAAMRHKGAGALAVFGMTAVTGPAEWWRLEAHGSFTGVEQADRALRPIGAGTGLTGRDEESASPLPPASWLAIHRPWLSYRPTEASRMLAKARYFQALIFRVAPGDEAEFVEAVRARKASLDGMNLDRPEMAYQVISGAPTITYLFLAPLASLNSFDELLARLPVYARAAAKTAAAGNLSHENVLFRVEPSLSTVDAETAAEDPDFWRSSRRQ